MRHIHQDAAKSPLLTPCFPMNPIAPSEACSPDMKNAEVNGIELEYRESGVGEPLLMISPVLADSFLPFFSQHELSGGFRLVAYHKRGWSGSTHESGPVSVKDHAADAAGLLDHLGIARAHVAGHSSGAAVALQLALDHPEKVHALVLLEPALLSVPSGKAFLEKAGPAFESYAKGEHEAAVAKFLSLASGLAWDECRAVIEERIPGTIAQAIKDAGTFFGVELPALVEWSFAAEQAASISQPALSVLGADTEQLWIEVDDFLRASLPRCETRKIESIGHLLHIQRPEPVAQAIAEFLYRHPMRHLEKQHDSPFHTEGVRRSP
jgi:pimeloyl-ACP methyl ester carboxylesterase